jgi:hypothetical protein
MTLSTSGNLGLGVTPSAWASGSKVIQLSSATAVAQSVDGYALLLNNAYESSTNTYKYLVSSYQAALYQQVSGQHTWFTAPSGTAGNAISFTQAMTLNADGNLSIGQDSSKTSSSVFWTSNQSGRLYVGTENSSGGSIVTGTAAYAGVVATNAAYPLCFGTNNAERARITSGGLFQLNQSSDTNYLFSNAAAANLGGALVQASTAGYAAIQGIHSSNSATGYCAYFNNSGSATGLYISNTAAWQSTSDERLKTDIKDFDATDKLMQLRPRDYLWKSQETSDTPDKRNFGFIAQEVQEIFPDLVGVSPDGMLSVEYTGLIAPLVKAIQEQQAMINDLKAKVAALESK